MVRKMGELPKFLVFNSGTKSFGNNSVFTFYLLLFAFIQISVLLMSMFQMVLNDYPHFYLAKDGRLCSTG
jgi:hypothetical protein